MTSDLPFDPEVVAEAARENAERVPVQAINGHDLTPQVLPPEFSDDALGLRFSHQFGSVLRYVASWGKWLIWNGEVWREDTTLRTHDLIRQSCRALSGEAKGPLRASLTSSKTISAVERLIRSDRRHAARVDQWDADHWMLNTPAGMVDLKTGELVEHDSKQHMTKMTAVAPADVADCPIWRGFLETVTARDKELQGYLQRMAGYGLTGSTQEHALFFAYGTGGNGKGTFLNTIQAIVADYVTNSPSETFTAKSQGAHLTELARLQGARMVISQETEEGKALAEARVKAITGGDPITANFMRQDHFTYVPQFKLIMSGNHRPALANVDEAIRRRFNMIPFDVTIPAESRDSELPEKLKAEYPAILRWMIDGCLWWQDIGLKPPASVLAATSDYFDTEDAFAQWIGETCTTRRDDWNTASELFKSWQDWCRDAGEYAGSQKRFSQALVSRGYVSSKIAEKRAFRGIALKIEKPFMDVD